MIMINIGNGIMGFEKAIVPSLLKQGKTRLVVANDPDNNQDIIEDTDIQIT